MTTADEPQRATLHVNLLVRPLAPSDLEKDFVVLLQQLSTVVRVDPVFFRERLNQVMEDKDVHMLVAEDTDLRRIVGFGMVVIEPKFVHNGGLVGHLEDLVVDFGLRRKGMGSMLVKRLVDIARNKGCYKIIADCAEANVAFYEKNGFKRKCCSMSRYFEGNAPADQILAKHFSVNFQPTAWGDEFMFRRLQESDYEGQFLKLLSQLTTVGDVKREQFEERARWAQQNPSSFIIVLERTSDHKVVAAGTLFLEQKFIRNAGVAGHIEDVVVDNTVRGKGLGKAIVTFLRDLAERCGCYKVILDCEESNRGFYEKCGFSDGHSPVCMAVYF